MGNKTGVVVAVAGTCVAAGAVVGCWVLGGLVAMGLAALSPEFYRRAFIVVPEAWGPMLRYALVGGSIWGAMFGGLLSAILGPIVFRSRWRQRAAEAGIATDSRQPSRDVPFTGYSG